MNGAVPPATVTDTLPSQAPLQLSFTAVGVMEIVESVTAKDWLALHPHELQACTVIDPPPPEAVTLMAVVPCPEMRVHPGGTAHV